MADTDAKQIYTNALPLIAVVLMASGIIVKSVPLESRRPVDLERVSVVYAGRQDVEARLWQDPFTAIRGIKGETAEKRCDEAKQDRQHQRLALRNSIAFRARNGDSISVLAVMLLGGPYFEEGEARRRSRYAVVSALLQTGWEPAIEDKLGYVWTLESCIEPPSARRAPELLPYEWFSLDASDGAQGGTRAPRRDLLVLWVDQSALSWRPLQGIERIVELLAVPCPSAPRLPRLGKASQRFIDCPQQSALPAELAEPLPAKACGWEKIADRRVDFGDGKALPLPWCETRVIGPVTSDLLDRLIRELARSSQSVTPADWLRFYSSGATAYLEDSTFQAAIDDARRAKPKPMSVKALREQFAQRVIRLTAPDNRLIDAFAEELGRRLVDPTPFSRIRGSPLCRSTVVLISEGDTSYARDFRQRFTSKRFGGCKEEGSFPRVVQVSYLRGLDGVLPVGAGAPVPAVAGAQARSPDTRDTLLDPVTLERADGRSQYDYLRRLAQQLGDIDREEKRAGHYGIRGIGVLGNDAYDKLLVLDALRERFPEAVFFAADLDARLISGGARSTRNLVVASAYGLALNQGIQGTAPPFRDTYQTGTYLATRVALDPSAAGLAQEKFDPWFKEPLLFEIGRTRAVPLSKGPDETCDGAKLMDCANIHALDEWKDAKPYPRSPVTLALAVMAAAAASLALLLSQAARRIVAGIWGRIAVTALVLSVVAIAADWAIWSNATSGLGEPFAWFEGVSIWPTQIFRLGILVLTVGLLAFGRWQLRRRIDGVAGDFGLATLTERTASPLPRIHGWRERFHRVWGATTKDTNEGDPWIEYLDRVRFRPSTMRIAVTTALFLAFSLALTSLDWPHSPHRGEWAAWINHGLLLLLLAAMIALLFAAFDASGSAARLFARLRPDTAMEKRGGADEKELRRQYPVGERAIEAWIRFRLAVRVASEVNWYIYLPFLTLLLIIPTQSRIFDDWNLPLPFVALFAISIALAVMCARRLRQAAERLKRETLEAIETERQNCRLGLPAGQAATEATLRAELLEQIAERIRAVRDGPFLPLSQEPAVRAILLLLGGAGGISTAEFLFASRG